MESAINRYAEKDDPRTQARRISPSWRPPFAAPQWSNLNHARLRRHPDRNFGHRELMKPTPQISSQSIDRQNFPLTDYNYQSTLETPRAALKEAHGSHRLHGLWKLSTGFFGAEAKLDYATELLLFSVITVLSAWPVISMAVAITRMVRNY